MAKTRIDLANRALVKLGVFGSGQSPDAEDTETVDGVFESMSETLSAQSVYDIVDEDDIELAAFEWLADYLAYLVAPDFGKPTDDGLRQRAEFMLRRITASRPTYQVVKAEYF
jgi:hypothetical protein